MLLQFPKTTFYFQVLLLVHVLICTTEESQDIAEIFDPDTDEVSFQRKFVINVANKAEDCYFIPDVQLNQILNFHFVVSFLFDSVIDFS